MKSDNCKYCKGCGVIIDKDPWNDEDVVIGGCPKCGGSGKAKDIREECGRPFKNLKDECEDGGRY